MMIRQGYFFSLAAVYLMCKPKPSTVVLLHVEPDGGLGLTGELSGESRGFA